MTVQYKIYNINSNKKEVPPTKLDWEPLKNPCSSRQDYVIKTLPSGNETDAENSALGYLNPSIRSFKPLLNNFRKIDMCNFVYDVICF